MHAGTKETFGLVLLEAMACGRPVVAARASAIPEFVDESVGMLAEPCNAASMADAIAALYERDLDAVGAHRPRARATALHLDRGIPGANDGLCLARRRLAGSPSPEQRHPDGNFVRRLS